eukprot:s329_g11.t1
MKPSERHKPQPEEVSSGDADKGGDGSASPGKRVAAAELVAEVTTRVEVLAASLRGELTAKAAELRGDLAATRAELLRKIEEFMREGVPSSVKIWQHPPFGQAEVKQRQLTEHQDLWLDDITLDVMDRQPGKAANRALKAYRLLSAGGVAERRQRQGSVERMRPRPPSDQKREVVRQMRPIGLQSSAALAGQLNEVVRLVQVIASGTEHLGEKLCDEVTDRRQSEVTVSNRISRVEHRLSELGGKATDVAKTGPKETGGLYFSWPNVFNIALFFCASLLATMSARWERELATQYVQRWRSHELQQVATKHWVLRAKLDDLMRHLDRLRAFWVDQTSTLSLRAQRSNKADSETANSTKEVQPEVSEELHRAWRVRLLDLCLQTGWSQEEIEPEVGVCDELGLEKAAEATIQLLETSVVSLMRTRELQVLRRITEEEVQNREAELLERLRQHARGQIAIPVPNEVTSSSEEDTSSPGQDGGIEKALRVQTEQPVQEQPLHAKAAEPEKVDPETNPAPASATLSSEAVPRPVDAEHPPAPAQPSQAELVQRTRPLLEAVIDDLLFYRVGDDTLQAHRKENTWWVLLGKACWSQTFCLLVAAAILQFASYRSVLAFGTMFTIVISRIFFPHAPPKLWRFLQIYNIVTITLKMLSTHQDADEPTNTVHQLSARDLVNIVRSPADPALLHRPLTAATAQKPKLLLEPQDCQGSANMVLGYASPSCAEDAWTQALESCHKDIHEEDIERFELRSAPARVFANRAQVPGAMVTREASPMATLAVEANMIVNEFEPRDLGRMAWAFSRLTTRRAKLMDAVGERVLTSPGFHIEDMATLARSPARLATRSL